MSVVFDSKALCDCSGVGRRGWRRGGGVARRRARGAGLVVPRRRRRAQAAGLAAAHLLAERQRHRTGTLYANSLPLVHLPPTP